MKTPKFEDYSVTVRPLSKPEGGGFLASIEEMPGCVGDGDTPEMALENLRGAFELMVEALTAWKEEIPKAKSKTPATFIFRPSRTLYERARQMAGAEGVSFNAWLSETVALRVGANQISV